MCDSRRLECVSVYAFLERMLNEGELLLWLIPGRKTSGFARAPVAPHRSVCLISLKMRRVSIAWAKKERDLSWTEAIFMRKEE